MASFVRFTAIPLRNIQIPQTKTLDQYLRRTVDVFLQNGIREVNAELFHLDQRIFLPEEGIEKPGYEWKKKEGQRESLNSNPRFLEGNLPRF